jgi:hypothetical protein
MINVLMSQAWKQLNQKEFQGTQIGHDKNKLILKSKHKHENWKQELKMHNT